MATRQIALADIFDDIYDYENRWYMIQEIAEAFGVAEIDKTILQFLVMGNVSPKSDFYSVLKGLKLPVLNVQFDSAKVRRWADLLMNEMEALDKYGVLRLDTLTLLKESENGRYVTLATMRINALIYKSIYNMLLTNPEYLLQVIYGVYDKLGVLIKFLGMEKKE